MFRRKWYATADTPVPGSSLEKEGNLLMELADKDRLIGELEGQLRELARDFMDKDAQLQAMQEASQLREKELRQAQREAEKRAEAAEAQAAEAQRRASNALEALADSRETHRDLMGEIRHIIDKMAELKREGFNPPSPGPIARDPLPEVRLPFEFEEVVLARAAEGSPLYNKLVKLYRPGMDEEALEDLVERVRVGDDPDDWGGDHDDEEE